MSEQINSSALPGGDAGKAEAVTEGRRDAAGADAPAAVLGETTGRDRRRKLRAVPARQHHSRPADEHAQAC